jgi:flavorubredoxin
VFYEETDGTLFCGDLLTHVGDTPALTESDIAGPAIAAEAAFRAMTFAPGTPRVLRELAALKPTTLALMHGASFRGDGAGQLAALADWCAVEAAAV